jgi:hypothetical protein
MGGCSSYDSSGSYDWGRGANVTRRSAQDYAKQDRREYTGFSSYGLGAPKGKEIRAESPLAVVLAVDVTGSMKEWPGLIFQKIPTLYSEANVALQGIKLGELEKGKKVDGVLEMAVIAIGDAPAGDRVPLQVGDFAKGSDLVNIVNRIYPEGGGRGNAKESYDLALYYVDRHCKTPNVPKSAKPILIIAGDEGFYEEVDPGCVNALIGDDIKQPRKTEDVIERIKKKFDTYMLRPEPSNYNYAPIHKQWQDALGSQRVLRMDDPARLVDCIIQICAYAAGNFDLGKDLLERRQTPKQVKEVLDALSPLTK